METGPEKVITSTDGHATEVFGTTANHGDAEILMYRVAVDDPSKSNSKTTWSLWRSTVDAATPEHYAKSQRLVITVQGADGAVSERAETAVITFPKLWLPMVFHVCNVAFGDADIVDTGTHSAALYVEGDERQCAFER